MLAIVKEERQVPFAVRERDVPVAAAGEVVVQVRAVGICGTDLPIFAGDRPVPMPLVPGHEFAGDIAEIGPGVQGWKPGDRVSVGLIIGCGRCPECREGRENLCPMISEIGIHRDGAYAEFVAVPEVTLHRLPDRLDYADGASVDPLASIYRGLRRLRIGLTDDVVIVGAGPIGLYALQIVIASGVASASVVVRHRDVRAEWAERLGGTVILEPDSIDELRARTAGRGATLVVEATGAPEVVQTLAHLAAPGATILVAGIHKGPSVIDVGHYVRRELRLTGTFGYSWTDFEASLGLIDRQTVRPVVSHRLPLARIGDGLDLVRRRDAVKVVLEP